MVGERTVGKLKVVIGADTKNARDNVSGFTNSLKSVGRVAKATGVAVAAMAAAMAAVGAVALVKMTKESLALIDAQAKLAGRIGGTTKAIQTMAHAGDLAGIEFSRLERSMEIFNARLGEAMREGIGPAAEALDRLGLSASDLSELDIDDRFVAIGERMRELGYSTQQTADVLRDFGIREQGLINLFEKGGEVIRGAQKDVEDFGVAVSDVDAAKIEQANDAMTRIGLVMTGIGNQIAVRLAPLLEGLATLIGDASRETGGFGDTIDWVINGAIGLIGGFLDAWKAVQEDILEVQEFALNLFAVFSKGWADATEATYNFIDATRQAWNSIAAHIPGLDEIAPASREQIIQNRREAEAAAESLKVVQAQLAEMRAAPLPSDVLNDWVEDVRLKSQEAAEAAIEARRKLVHTGDDDGGGSGSGVPGSAASSDSEREARERRLQELRDSLLSEKELEMQMYAERLAELKNFYNERDLTEQEYTALREKAAREHADKLIEIERRAQEVRDQIQQETLSRLTSTLDAISSSLESSGEEQFGIAKGFALASALLKGYEAVTSAYAAGAKLGGPGLGAVYAGLAAAQTAAQIANLRGVSSSSKGSPTAGGGGSAAGAGTGGSQVPGQTTYVQLHGEWFRGDQLASVLKEYQRDGGQIIVERV